MKRQTLTLRVDESDMAYLELAVEAVKKETGVSVVNKSWIVLELMKFGREEFEKQFKLKISGLDINKRTKKIGKILDKTH